MSIAEEFGPLQLTAINGCKSKLDTIVSSARNGVKVPLSSGGFIR